MPGGFVAIERFCRWQAGKFRRRSPSRPLARSNSRTEIAEMSRQLSVCAFVAFALGSSLELFACSPATPEAARPAATGSVQGHNTADPDSGSTTTISDQEAPPLAPVSDAASQATEIPSTSSERCSQDSDCVPAACCHPAACVVKSRAPNCAAMMCTMECRPKTLDCGGHCTCVEGRCSAILSDMSHLGPPPSKR
jgi:hypothetical protein